MYQGPVLAPEGPPYPDLRGNGPRVYFPQPPGGAPYHMTANPAGNSFGTCGYQFPATASLIPPGYPEEVLRARMNGNNGGAVRSTLRGDAPEFVPRKKPSEMKPVLIVSSTWPAGERGR
ncbi:hypothetical protein BO78DRAFT_178209 [Aspergillus sclerotiicarbonarius CBS 121057]|uniref:Uncharacterized protein n=1 Tax=Aspergillus sclerotiicarbonarius (strain CBS 121057 / IBT 28362) TaxID=1448318 RepID=A0A319E299_ASPSB|nr:hypothetical protein BO78DRAFT_178209 [Aspergillus sclerotiicarbonarius CBS 121057]